MYLLGAIFKIPTLTDDGFFGLLYSPATMRVVLPVHIFLPEHRAGVETYTFQLARELARNDEVSVVTSRKVISRETGFTSVSSVDGIRVYEVVNNLCHDEFEQTWRQPAMERAFAAILDELRPDLVHFQHLMYWSLGLPALVKQQGRPCFMTLHDYWLGCGRFGQLVDHQGRVCPGPEEERCAPCLAATPFAQPDAERRWIRRLTRFRRLTGIPLDGPMRSLRRLLPGSKGPPTAAAAPTDESTPEWRARYRARETDFLRLSEQVDRFITPSDTLKTWMIRWGIPESRILRLPQGRDHAAFRGLSRRDTAGPLRLAFIGTIAPHKGVDVLMRAVLRLPADRVELRIFGPGHQHAAYLEECRKLAERSSNISILGPRPSHEIPTLYRDIDLLCVPSIWNECCPLTIQEAQMAGVPCVVSGMGGMAELIRDGVDGLHAKPGDVSDWTRALNRLLDEPELRASLAANRPKVPDLSEHVERLREIYAGGS